MKVLATYNHKGGVGKTATAVNLAHRAAEVTGRVLLWDLDPQGASTYYFRIRPKVKGGARKILKREDKLRASIRASDFERLDVLPSDFSYRHLDLDLGRAESSYVLKNCVERVAEEYEVVVFDCPPNISVVSENVFRACQALLVPTIPTTLSLRTLARLLEHLDHTFLVSEAPLVLPFFSMVDSRKTLHRKLVGAARQTAPGFLEACIPYSSDVERMGVHQNPVSAFAGRKPIAGAYRELWSEFEERLRTGRGGPALDAVRALLVDVESVEPNR